MPKQELRIRGWEKGMASDIDQVDADITVLKTITNGKLSNGYIEYVKSDSYDDSIFGDCPISPTRIHVQVCDYDVSGSANLTAWYWATDGRYVYRKASGGSWELITDLISTYDVRFYQDGNNTVISYGNSGTAKKLVFIDNRERFNSNSSYTVNGWQTDSVELDNSILKPTVFTSTDNAIMEDKTNYDELTVHISMTDGVSGNYNGEHVDYYMTLVFDDNQESALQYITGFNTGSGIGIQIADIMMYGDVFNNRITGIKIYRSVDYGPKYLLMDIDINDGWTDPATDTDYNWEARTSLSGADTTGLFDLGGSAGYIDDYSRALTDAYYNITGWDEDTESTSLAYNIGIRSGERMIVADVTKNGQSYPQRIYVSPTGRPDCFPDDAYIDIIGDDSRKYTALAIWNRLLFAFKENRVDIINISSPLPTSWTLVDTFPIGVDSQDHATVANTGVWFFNDAGVWVYDGTKPTNIIEHRYYNEWIQMNPTNIFYDSRYNEVKIVDGSTLLIFDSQLRITKESIDTNGTVLGTKSPFIIDTDLTPIAYYQYDSNKAIVKLNYGSGYKTISLETHDIDFGTNNDKMLFYIQLSFMENTGTTLSFSYSINNGSYITKSITFSGNDLVKIPLHERFTTLSLALDSLSIRPKEISIVASIRRHSKSIRKADTIA